MTSPFYGFRVMGVLQRISLCYLTVSIMYLYLPNVFYHIAILVCCIALYLGFMYGYPVPPFDARNLCGRGVVTPECNFDGYLSRLMFGNSSKYMFYPFDPEGLFSTLTALLNTFSGLCFSLLMRYNTQKKGNKVDLLLCWALLSLTLIGVGYLITQGDACNKKRWSVSFAFISSGFSGAVLCLCFVVVDMSTRRFIKEKLV
jgi:predicted acyltransferase